MTQSRATSVSILLLEDDPLDAQLVAARLREARAQFTVERVENRASFQAALARGGFDVILADYNVPGFDGIAALAEARVACPEVPFLFVSGALGEEQAIELLKRGAIDYVLKDNLDRLVPCVDRALAEAREHEERVRAEEALRRSEARSRALIAALVEGITVQDPRGRFLEVNASAEALLGVSRAEFLGHDGGGLPRPVVREDGTTYPCEEQPMAVALRTGQSQVGRIVGVYRPDQTLVWLSVNSQPLLEDDGETLAGVVSSFFDVTERKQRAELEQQLIGIVSHDLRTPLSAIMYAAHALLLREAELDERTVRAAQRIRSSGERASRLINDLLDFTQVRLGGGIPLNPRAVDFHQCARTTLDELESLWLDRQVLLEQHGDGEGWWDPDRLAQVVQNLMTNAFSYSPANTAVRVRTRGEPDAVTLEIHNEGAPIPPERLPHIFDAMQRGRHLIEPRKRSVGLGLFIVYHIVRAHGGSVSVRSTAADGTTFHVHLPRSVAAAVRAC